MVSATAGLKAEALGQDALVYLPRGIYFEGQEAYPTRMSFITTPSSVMSATTIKISMVEHLTILRQGNGGKTLLLRKCNP